MRSKRALCDSGQALSEYLILLLLISFASLAAARSLGNTLRRKLELAERHVQKELSPYSRSPRDATEGEAR